MTWPDLTWPDLTSYDLTLLELQTRVWFGAIEHEKTWVWHAYVDLILPGLTWYELGSTWHYMTWLDCLLSIYYISWIHLPSHFILFNIIPFHFISPHPISSHFSGLDLGSEGIPSLSEAVQIYGQRLELHSKGEHVVLGCEMCKEGRREEKERKWKGREGSGIL